MNLGVVSSFALVSVSPLATDVQVGDICTLSTEHLYSTGAVSPGSVCQLGIGDTFLVDHQIYLTSSELAMKLR